MKPEISLVFPGSGCYGDQPGPKVMKFIDANDFKGRKVAYFSTCWSVGLIKPGKPNLAIKRWKIKG
jgi:hypothetical protein